MTNQDSGDNYGQFITITKIEAAQRQLETAIKLSFEDGDPVSILTLSYSSYEIIHKLFRKRGLKDDLIYDNSGIKEEFRKEWNTKLKEVPNFLKHSNRGDEDEETNLTPVQGDVFIIFSIIALQQMGLPLKPIHDAFMTWAIIRFPYGPVLESLKTQGVDINQIAKLQAMSRADFLRAFMGHFHSNR